MFCSNKKLLLFNIEHKNKKQLYNVDDRKSFNLCFSFTIINNINNNINYSILALLVRYKCKNLFK